uniref:Putative secreted protein n=1 Tax=Anopheles darlingi TaxID=43151 RepID=A0A2M4DN74_ANODA
MFATRVVAMFVLTKLQLAAPFVPKWFTLQLLRPDRKLLHTHIQEAVVVLRIFRSTSQQQHLGTTRSPFSAAFGIQSWIALEHHREHQQPERPTIAILPRAAWWLLVTAFVLIDR